MIGAAPPTMLPQKFIQPDTVAENLPAISVQLVQAEVMENPKDMSARVKPSRVVHFCKAVAVRNNPTAQNVKPKPPNPDPSIRPMWKLRG
jgi:hypothetical protein